MSYSDLHVHLYGCLTSDILYELARSKQNISWQFFENGFEQAFQFRPDIGQLLSLPQNQGFEEFRKVYQMTENGDFSQFQAKFNLIIAIANLRDPEEAGWLVRKICKNHHAEKLIHVEYRMLFPPWVDQLLFNQLVQTICHEMARYEESTSNDFEPRFSLSLPRTESGPIHYQWLRALMQADHTVAYITTSVDFCFIEEGFPPKNQRLLFQKILDDNRKKSEQALAILYHVGESFGDKSLESAIRWIHESAELGAHRLGHAIALGINPELYLGQTSRETVAERMDQLDYDLKYFQELTQIGIIIDRDHLQSERKNLQEMSGQYIECVYDANRVDACKKRQDFVMDYLK
ncbi:MAG: hypothetical protein HQM12_14540, partial [SAR324 cluster bacterium]|nr:hypothetical protein [SAR324 cluster bacterium]